MSKRLEIRIHDDLKESVIAFCNDNSIDMTYYVITLIRRHLKREGYLKRKMSVPFEGDIEDMPLNL